MSQQERRSQRRKEAEYCCHCGDWVCPGHFKDRRKQADDRRGKPKQCDHNYVLNTMEPVYSSTTGYLYVSVCSKCGTVVKKECEGNTKQKRAEELKKFIKQNPMGFLYSETKRGKSMQVLNECLEANEKTRLKFCQAIINFLAGEK